MTPSGLSPVVPAETVFAATAQTAQLVSKSNVRGFMVTVGKLTRHACAYADHRSSPRRSLNRQPKSTMILLSLSFNMSTYTEISFLECAVSLPDMS